MTKKLTNIMERLMKCESIAGWFWSGDNGSEKTLGYLHRISVYGDSGNILFYSEDDGFDHFHKIEFNDEFTCVIER